MSAADLDAEIRDALEYVPLPEVFRDANAALDALAALAARAEEAKKERDAWKIEALHHNEVETRFRASLERIADCSADAFSAIRIARDALAAGKEDA